MSGRLPIRPLAFALTLALTALSTACGLAVQRRHVAGLPAQPERSATLPQLVEAFNHQANAIQSMKLKLELAGSSGGPRTGTISQLKWTITTFLLIEKPARVRLFGEFTLVGRVFDMASDGQRFEVNLPQMNRFVVGDARASAASPVPHAGSPSGAGGLESLRPAVILDAMLINPIETAAGQHVMFINDRAETAAEYGVLVYQPSADGFDRLLRRIVFSRYDLLPRRQVIYDTEGLPATQATYDQYVDVQGVPVPSRITIARPEEEYSLTLTLAPGGATLNPPALPAGTWQLAQPAHSKLVDLDAGHSRQKTLK